MSAGFVIGIDLGTTNSSLAFIKLTETSKSEPELLAICQWENDEQSIEDYRLPSFLWLLPKAQLKKGFRPHPAIESYAKPWVIGRQARDKALAAPLEVIHSAKSWLSSGPIHHRLAKILPWGSGGDRLSPLEVQTAILEHLKWAWNARFPAFPFEEQRVIITVPASFDELAQRLTLEAAKIAGFPKQVELLEEPLAAYYDWEARNVSQHGTILVCDMGGGTCDFTLLSRNETGTKRIKVSEHLLLGGDNIDLALAHRLAQRLSPDELPRAAWNLLLAQTRRLKEEALRQGLVAEGTEPEPYHLSIPLNPQQLFGIYLSAEVSPLELRDWILADFFPPVLQDTRPARAAGLQTWGLPYAKDTAVTKHLAEFLNGHTVDALLCVGGSLLPQSLQQRLLETLSSWQKTPLTLLEHAESDLAIAYGAARFGGRRARAETLISSPYPRQLLIEVEEKGRSGTRNVCLIPKNHPRMTPYEVQLEGLHIRLGQEVRFQIIAENPDGRKSALSPLLLKLAAHEKKDLIPIRLEATVRETGVLEVSCHALGSHHVWTLDFAIESGRAANQASELLYFNKAPKLDEAQGLIKRYFSRQNTGKLRIEQLPQAMEDLFAAPREQWTADQLRGLWPALESVMFQRSISVEHEAIWFYMTGFCLRPGWGYSGDAERMESLLRIYDESFRRVDSSLKLLMHWWILWRRLAGGLSPVFQQRLYDRYMPILRKEKTPSPELIRLLASLERLEKGFKEQLGRQLLANLRENAKNNPEAHVWGLARIASRYPVYATAANVLLPATVENWSDELTALKLGPKARPALFYAWAGRMRGDKQYDIDPAYRLKFLDQVDNAEWRKALTEVIVPDFTTQSQMLADSLPSGFVFHSS